MSRTFDVDAAADFVQMNARMLDRRRFSLLLGQANVDAALTALDAHRNPDGGYGWGLEPDLRAAESQPGAALHAFEAFADAAPATTPRAVELCDWLGSVTLPDGGLPFALPVADPAGVAPFWAHADPAVSSLQITAFVTAMAHRVAAHDRAVAEHPWLARATEYCCAAIRAIDDRPHALALTAALWFLDAVGETALIERLGRFIPASGVLHVGGGAEDEVMRPLDFAPFPGPARGLFSDDAIAADLERLTAQQQADGGWSVDFV